MKTKKFVFETDNLNSFMDVLGAYITNTFHEGPNEYAKMFIAKSERLHMPSEDEKCIPLCSISEYTPLIKNDSEVHDSYQTLLSRIRNILSDSKEEHKSHIDDADASLGYQVKHRHKGGFDILNISLCPIEYRK